MLNTYIKAIGGYVPEEIRTNEYLASISDTSNEWILRRTGINERRILDNTLATSDMAVKAIKDLITGIVSIDEIDCLIMATSTPDMPMPSTASIVCRKLGIENIFGFDINAACSGFLYALTIGSSLIETGRYKNVIVVGADKMSSVTDVYDRKTNILFGDGAGAVLLNPSFEENGIIDMLMQGNGNGTEFLNIEGGGSLKPPSLATLIAKDHYIKQEGKVVFRNAIEKMTLACCDILKRNNLEISDVDWLVPHQANRRIIDTVGKNLKITSEKVLVNVDRYGNTTAATIPLCLWDFHDKFKKGDLILLTSFGAGFSWGAMLIKWNN